MSIRSVGLKIGSKKKLCKIRANDFSTPQLGGVKTEYGAKRPPGLSWASDSLFIARLSIHHKANMRYESCALDLVYVRHYFRLFGFLRLCSAGSIDRRCVINGGISCRVEPSYQL